MHYERTEHIQKVICDICKSPLSCIQIAQRLDFSPQRTMYHLRQLIADHRIIRHFSGGRMNQNSYRYQTNTSGVVIHDLQKSVDRILYDEPVRNRSVENQIKDSYSHGSAMLNVKNLAEKLKRQSQMMRAERKSSRTYVGISSVYNG